MNDDFLNAAIAALEKERARTAAAMENARKAQGVLWEIRAETAAAVEGLDALLNELRHEREEEA